VVKDIVEISRKLGFGVQPAAALDVDQILAQRYTFDDGVTLKDLGFELCCWWKPFPIVSSRLLKRGLQ
jgi:hypothetical protein